VAEIMTEFAAFSPGASHGEAQRRCSSVMVREGDESREDC